METVESAKCEGRGIQQSSKVCRKCRAGLECIEIRGQAGRLLFHAKRGMDGSKVYDIVLVAQFYQLAQRIPPRLTAMSLVQYSSGAPITSLQRAVPKLVEVTSYHEP